MNKKWTGKETGGICRDLMSGNVMVFEESD
jgi:hypothetical protein